MEFSEAEKKIIATVLSQEKFQWDCDELTDIKKNIKLYLKDKWTEQCCYCSRGMEDEFNMVIDIEHILPKSQFKTLAFEPDNLHLSCKRCNMNIKNERTDFLQDLGQAHKDFRDSANYKFIHPNLDTKGKHITYVNCTINETKFIKFHPLTEKGQYSYSYFRLENIERNSFSKAQGISEHIEELHTEIPSEILKSLEALLKQL